jgi:putative transposase
VYTKIISPIKEMRYTYQYKALPDTSQKLELNDWLRICQYWYNKQIGDRFDWWESNRSAVNACPIFVTTLPVLRDNPNYYSQKKYLPGLKKQPQIVEWSAESLDFSRVPANTLQQVCKRVALAFERFLSGDAAGNRSGKPRFKNKARYRSMVFEGAGLELHSCSVGGKYSYITIPKLGLVKVRSHRHLPDGAVLKQVQLIKKNDGWFANLSLEDDTVPVSSTDIIPTWDNSMGMDAVLHEDDYLATSDGEKLPSIKVLRKNKSRLAKASRRKNAKKRGSKSRRKLAKREGKIHQQIARCRKDFQYKTAHQLVRTGKKVFFHENLNLKGLTKRCKPKQDEQTGEYLPNGQSAKSGLNLSWSDAAFGNFFTILGHIAGKAGAIVLKVNPAYTSQLLSYRDEVVFTDTGIREYWDESLKLLVDRDINAGINIKRVGLDMFPTIKRRKGRLEIVANITDDTSKEVVQILRGL